MGSLRRRRCSLVARSRAARRSRSRTLTRTIERDSASGARACAHTALTVSAPSAAPRRVGRAGSEGGVASDTNTNRLRGDGAALVRARGAGTKHNALKHNACTARTETASERRETAKWQQISQFSLQRFKSFNTDGPRPCPSIDKCSPFFTYFSQPHATKAQQRTVRNST